MLNDELSDLANFAAVADARSFTRAAVKLGKSQSARRGLDGNPRRRFDITWMRSATI
jgi:hypothetical protein